MGELSCRRIQDSCLPPSPAILQATSVAMSEPITISRTAPIPIATKSNHKTTDTSEKENSKSKGSSSMRSLIDGDLPNIRTRKDRPCDACRRRKSKCVIHKAQSACVLCKFHKQDCTFVQSPQPRKRKLVIETREQLHAEGRYVYMVSIFLSDKPLEVGGLQRSRPNSIADASY